MQRGVVWFGLLLSLWYFPFSPLSEVLSVKEKKEKNSLNSHILYNVMKRKDLEMKTTIGNWSRGYVKKKTNTVKKATAWLKLCQLLCVYL